MVWEDQPTEVEANESESTAVPPQCLKEGKPPRRGCACVAAECPLKRDGPWPRVKSRSPRPLDSHGRFCRSRIKPSGRVLRVSLCPAARVQFQRCDPDGSLLRLETPA